MPGTVIIGSQWGDEGKGKVTDFYGETADLVVRYQGGNNAGHTVVVGDRKMKFHLLPSGIMRAKHVFIGAGVVIDPRVLKKELENLEKIGKEVHLTIDPRAHIIFPWHNLEDGAQENEHGGEKIGTTGRGIGPAYADKCYRTGIRFEDLINEKRLKQKVEKVYPFKKKLLEKTFGVKIKETADEIFNQYNELGKEFLQYVGDVSLEVNEALDSGKNVMFEGAQGTFLDNDFGTYPYVTSSHPISGGVATGVGMAINKISRIIGIVKAYTTRVGEGPFPTELTGRVGDDLREKGQEYGTTTGRPRRVGWLDIPLLRTSMRLNGFTEIALTKLDVLSGFEKLKVAISYSHSGKTFDYFPYSMRSVEKAQVQYREFEGFTLSGKEKKFKDLPKSAQNYIKFIEEKMGVPIKLVSLGPERSQTILVD